MDRHTENRLIGALSAVAVAGLIVMAAGIAIGVTSGHAHNPSPTIPPEKQALTNRILHPPTPDPSQAANHEPKPFDSDVPTPIPLADGIYGGSQAPYPAGEFMSKNMWIGHASGLRILVYAGSEGSSAHGSGRGLLMVDTYSDQVPGGSYLAPSGVGSLHIVSYDGTRLTLHAATGETFNFDAETRAFTDTNGNPRLRRHADAYAVAYLLPSSSFLLSPVPFPPCQQRPRLLPLTYDNGGRQSATYAPHTPPRPLDAHLRVRRPA